MERHDLKILPIYFEAVLDGSKTFELRKQDRIYEVGDEIELLEWDNRYTGRRTVRKITYLLHNVVEYGLKKDFVIIGIK